jgi:flagellar biogenesis protein FliO
MKKLLFTTLILFFPLFSTVVTVDPTPEVSPAQITSEQLPANYQHVLIKTVVFIVGTLAIVFLLMLLLKRFSMIRYGNLNHQSYIKVIERRPLSTKTCLYLVQIGNQKVVVAESQLEVKKITEIETSHH